MELFPALLIGGPPDSGKSVLTYHLTQRLRRQGVEHYVIRANPDGEGDWRAEANHDLVRTILFPRNWTPAFVAGVCKDISNRQLPLLVDIGGRPQPWQETILDHCTHAVLLTPDDDTRAQWLSLIQRHNLLLIADLRSELHGHPVVTADSPLLTGVITGLEWGQTLRNPTFDALVKRVTHLFAYDPDELRRTHLAFAPTEIVVDLDRLARTLGVHFLGQKAIWEPRHLIPVLDYLPEHTPLALYGRAPNWLYAAVAHLSYPAVLHQFDPRLGWVTPPALQLGPAPADAPLQAHLSVHPDHVYLDFFLPTSHLDYSESSGLIAPQSPAGLGVIIGGQIPLWLYTGLALAYRYTPWVAVYQPQIEGAVVVHSSDPTHPVGKYLDYGRP